MDSVCTSCLVQASDQVMLDYGGIEREGGIGTYNVHICIQQQQKQFIAQKHAYVCMYKDGIYIDLPCFFPHRQQSKALSVID